ncbi:16S rRNA (guanine(527)-N(7))-methyltransferase RsmG [Gynuella sunshinyii]|uniref:Ribosomal RNA small subunit methyltransferase G n=1 Tax=Gynuella sunshinyii YC6258 TaxID=1445510 RepID=A0A0C5VF92_9GAMM|nr:16S rRNA (guanine(527)-N(7))-methyltransferase RsmG [Gynuella sunshinyii]AJQ92078.1 putative S-adenosylmethionine-dependent methyltransferase involved in bacterial cell division [Gynuella sunshinyii YC6258]
MSTHYQEKLLTAARQLGIDINDRQIEQLLHYHQLLVKWNKAYNLTAVRDAEDMIDRHLIDSLAILPFIQYDDILDVGSGGGLPGLVIAIMNPDIRVTVLDSNGKKTRFCTQVKLELQLSNVTVVHTRLENYCPAQPHACITSRAFASLRDMVELSAGCGTSATVYLAMKGQYPEAELAELPATVELLNVKELLVPGADGERHLVTLNRV